jgi:Domain of unknown function DUF29
MISDPPLGHGMLVPMGNLYDQDLVLWSEEQARALRTAAGAGWNAPIDWENVAEEIESLGKSERRALASHIAVVIEHLLKLQASPAAEPSRGWRDTIRRTRQKIEEVLEESPSLRHEVAGLVARQTSRAHALVRANLQDYGEQPRIDIESVTYTDAQVLGDWLPQND